MRAVDLSPLRPSDQTESPVDLFLIFAGANIVATTLQVGASLPPGLGLGAALTVIVLGSVGGAALVAALAPIGVSLRVPSIVAARAPLGFSGARALALLLFATNFAWIALNNVIAASIVSTLTGGGQSAWSALFGLVAMFVVLGGPRTAALVDRIAVPLLVVAGVIVTIACLRAPRPPWPVGPGLLVDRLRGLDIVAGYQVSWLLMFADYPRFVRSRRGASMAVFLGLALTALWFVPLGLVASAVAQSADPGAMVQAIGLGVWGAVLVTVAALTTNFVNIYMSALAYKSLRPAASDTGTIWLIGGIGAALSLLSYRWIEQFANFTLVLAGTLVPVGGVLLAHYVVLRRPVAVGDLYDSAGPYARRGGWSVAGAVAWLAGAIAFYVARDVGGTLVSLLGSIAIYVVLDRSAGARAARLSGASKTARRRTDLVRAGDRTAGPSLRDATTRFNPSPRVRV